MGRNAWPVEPASIPHEVQARVVRGHHYGGYLFREGAPPAELELCDGEQEMFAPCKAYHWSSNVIIFAGVDFEGEAEGQAREALEELRPLTTVRHVPATLRLAYGFAVLHRRARQLGAQVAPAEVLRDLVPVAEMGVTQANVVLQRLMQERMRVAARVASASVAVALSPVVVPGQPRERISVPPSVPSPVLTKPQRAGLTRHEREAEQRTRWQRMLGLPREARPKQMSATLDNAPDRAEAALEAAGARPIAIRLLDPGRLEVRYRFLNHRFITVVHPLTLQVLDAGICLAGADRMVTLDSLPSVIREGVNTHRLVITRHD
ncbi:MAG: hypothetical protein RMJ98_00830 [Myxococcales bacterium]|nr:hypothetical protein [Myxococcales bacterium]